MGDGRDGYVPGVDPGQLRLNDVEALMWRLERHDARLRPVITVVALLDRSPGVELLARRADALVAAAPRFAARVAPQVAPLGPPHLVPAGEIDHAHHVRVVALPGGGGLEALLDMVGPWSTDPLDLARPLWQLTLVEGMAGGRAAVVARVHHCLADGVGLVALAGALFGDDPADPRRAGVAAPHGPVGDAGPGGAVPGTGWEAWLPGGAGVAASAARLAADVAAEGRQAWGLLRSAGTALAGMAGRAAAAPEAEAARLREGAAGLARALDPTGRPGPTPMWARSAGAVLGATALPLEAVRAAGRAAGATVNDVFVDAVVEGLRRYHAKHGAHPGRLRIGVPVHAGDGPGGNHLLPARIDVAAQAEPAVRLAEVHRLVVAARHEPPAAAWAALAAVGARVPGAEALLAQALRGLDAVASNVPGTEAPLHLGPARVLALVPFGPRSGAACNVTTTSYAGALHVGISVDPAAAPDATTLLECLTGALGDSIAA